MYLQLLLHNVRHVEVSQSTLTATQSVEVQVFHMTLSSELNCAVHFKCNKGCTWCPFTLFYVC